MLSWRVAEALRVLGIRASHVGHEGDRAPARGSSDAEVLEHARRTNQVIVTSNLRTKTELLDLHRARALVLRRMRTLEARKRARIRKVRSDDPTLLPEA